MTDLPRRFQLVRDVDITGVSGTGTVADGVLWPDGTASVRWRGTHASIVFWDRGMTSVDHIHGHGGATRIVWLDEDDTAPHATAAPDAQIEAVLEQQQPCSHRVVGIQPGDVLLLGRLEVDPDDTEFAGHIQDMKEHLGVAKVIALSDYVDVGVLRPERVEHRTPAQA